MTTFSIDDARVAGESRSEHAAAVRPRGAGRPRPVPGLRAVSTRRPDQLGQAPRSAASRASGTSSATPTARRSSDWASARSARSAACRRSWGGTSAPTSPRERSTTSTFASGSSPRRTLPTTRGSARVIGKFFTPKNIEAFRPRVEEIVASMLDEIERRAPGPVDIVELLASPLPLLMVSEVMGVPSTIASTCTRCRSGSGRGSTWTVRSTACSPRVRPRGDSSATCERCSKRSAPTRSRDVISGMIEAAAQNGKMDELDLFATVSVLIQGGHSTTMGLLGRGLRGLLEPTRPVRVALPDPDGLASSATEELLRWTSPAQRPPPRWVYEDIEIGGQEFRCGEVVEPMIASANRDETVFSDPDRIDITRLPNPHLGFGGGVHRCVGSTLARFEGQVVFREIARRFPNLAIDESAEPDLYGSTGRAGVLLALAHPGLT